MLLKAVALVGAAYLLGFFSKDVPDTQTKTTETGLENHQPVNPGVGIQKMYRTSRLDKTIIKELMNLDGQTFPENYESRLFTFSRGSINPQALSDVELDEINQTFAAIKCHMMELFRNKYSIDMAIVEASDVEAVYIYSFSHKATTLECLTSNDICQPANSQPINTKHTTESNDKGSVLGDYEKMFTSGWILKNSEPRMKDSVNDEDYENDIFSADFTRKKSLLERISGFLTLSRIVEADEKFPTMGFRAVFLMTDPNKENIHIVTTGRSYTLVELDADQLTKLYKTLPGKQISSFTGLAENLNKKINNDS